jgi:hypothetical protein
MLALISSIGNGSRFYLDEDGEADETEDNGEDGVDQSVSGKAQLEPRLLVRVGSCNRVGFSSKILAYLTRQDI